MAQEERDKGKGTVSRLLDFAGDRRGLTYVGCVLSAVAMAVNMGPYVCIWLVVRDLVAVAPNWKEAHSISGYGWAAFGFAVLGIVVYFCALMCTHRAACRTATNVQGVLGVFIANIDLILGYAILDPTLRALVVAFVMAVLSPVMAALGGDGDKPEIPRGEARGA